MSFPSSPDFNRCFTHGVRKTLLGIQRNFVQLVWYLLLNALEMYAFLIYSFMVSTLDSLLLTSTFLQIVGPLLYTTEEKPYYRRGLIAKFVDFLLW
jgi:hypothetical protein